MILVIGKTKKSAERLAETFNIMGYLSLGVTASMAERELSPRFRAIVILYPAEIGTFHHLLSALSSSALKIPVFEIGKSDDERISISFAENTLPSTVIKKITQYLTVKGMAVIGKYRCAGFDASSELGEIYYFDRRIHLTKSEKMILRFLARSYPLAASAEDIIRFAIRPSRTPSPSSIRTHVSLMNKKFREHIGRQMIEFKDGEGYILITPENKKQILR